MASTQWKDANRARNFEGPLLCRHGEIEQLAKQCVRSEQVEPHLFWVVLNLPNQTSRTLYLGSSQLDATMIEATARGAVAHALEYALPY